MSRETRALLMLSGTVLLLVALVAVAWLYLDSARVVQPAEWKADGQTAGAGEVASRQATEEELAVARRALGSNSVIALSIERFRIRMGRYPVTLDELVKEPEQLGPRERWDGPYINNPHLLVDPWGKRYHYKAPGEHNDFSYDLWTHGSDGVAGTSDDNGNW